jgi:SAM-dependent methyltransferase
VKELYTLWEATQMKLNKTTHFVNATLAAVGLISCGDKPTQFSSPDSYRSFYALEGTALDKTKRISKAIESADASAVVKVESGMSKSEEAVADSVMTAILSKLFPSSQDATSASSDSSSGEMTQKAAEAEATRAAADAEAQAAADAAAKAAEDAAKAAADAAKAAADKLAAEQAAQAAQAAADAAAVAKAAADAAAAAAAASTDAAAKAAAEEAARAAADAAAKAAEDAAKAADAKAAADQAAAQAAAEAATKAAADAAAKAAEDAAKSAAEAATKAAAEAAAKKAAEDVVKAEMEKEKAKVAVKSEDEEREDKEDESDFEDDKDLDDLSVPNIQIGDDAKAFKEACRVALKIKKEDEKKKIVIAGDAKGKFTKDSVLLVVANEGTLNIKPDAKKLRGVCVYASKQATVNLQAGKTKISGVFVYERGNGNKVDISFSEGGKFKRGLAVISGTKDNSLKISGASESRCKKFKVYGLTGSYSYSCSK